MVFDQSDLERTFGQQVLALARGLVARNAVTNIRFAPLGDAVRASVQDEGAKPCAVRLLVRESGGAREIESDCSCDVADACRHGAALALTLLERGALSGGGASDQAVDTWIADVRQLEDDAHRERASERLVYVLDVPEARGLRAIRITPYITYTGTNRAPREYAVSSINGGTARFITPVDRTIGRLLSASGLLGLGQPVSPPILGMALDFITSRASLHWRDPLAPPLAKTPREHGDLIWQPANDERLRPRLADLPSAILVPSAPLWYVDPQNGAAGPVALDADAELAAALARAPSMTAQQAQRAQIALHRIFTLHGITGPANDLAIEIESREPQPVLRLGLDTAGRPTGGLLFAYGDQLVPPSDPRDHLRVERDGAVTVWPRDRAFEMRAQDRLERMDFPPYGEDAWLRFLERDAPVLRHEGWRIETHPSFPFRIVEAGDEWSAEVYENGAAQWFELELGIEVNGTRVSLLPVLIDALSRSGFDLDADPAQLAKREEPFVGRMPGGGYVALPPERVARVLATLGGLFGGGHRAAPKDRVRVPLLQAASLAAASGIVTHWQNAPSVREMLRDLAAFADRRIDVPETFHGDLRPYQREGVAWLQTLRDHRAGGILADDMGLGKTVMLLAHVAIERAAGRLTKPVLVVAPTSVVPNWRAEIARFLPSAADAIELTSYALLLRNAKRFAAQEWSIVVLDEAQAIKNPQSKGALAASQLQADQRLALTGTPIENHLDELWSLFNYALPGLLPNRSRFTRLFRTPIEKRGDADRRSALAARIKPFLLRRTKEAVAQELPPKTEIIQRVALAGRQRDLYETVRLTMHKRVRDEVQRRGLARSRIVVLDALLKLRQICCDPRLLRLEDQEQPESQKLEALLEMLESLIDDGRRILLFSQFTSMLDLIKPELQKRAISFVELRGDTRDRETPVKQFQAREVPLFLISLKAGGTGLTLTAADTVIHYDPWWNPAVERQATDRAHRIGQDQHVFIYKLIAEDTVEERILELQERKGALAQSLFEESASAGIDLELSDIDRLFG